MGLLNWIFGGSNTKDAKAVSLEPAKKCSTITSPSSRSRHVIIDSEERNGNRFSSDATITEVTLSGSVNAIRDEEFHDCVNLKKVNIADGLKLKGSEIVNRVVLIE